MQAYGELMLHSTMVYLHLTTDQHSLEHSLEQSRSRLAPRTPALCNTTTTIFLPLVVAVSLEYDTRGLLEFGWIKTKAYT